MVILAEGNCKSCGRRGVVNPEARHSEEKRREGEKERRLNAYFERPSMRSICRIVKVSRPTLAKWLKRTLANPELTDMLAPAKRKDVLEWDEAWSFVKCRSARRWLWIALCRRT